MYVVVRIRYWLTGGWDGDAALLHNGKSIRDCLTFDLISSAFRDDAQTNRRAAFYSI